MTTWHVTSRISLRRSATGFFVGARRSTRAGTLSRRGAAATAAVRRTSSCTWNTPFSCCGDSRPLVSIPAGPALQRLADVEVLRGDLFAGREVGGRGVLGTSGCHIRYARTSVRSGDTRRNQKRRQVPGEHAHEQVREHGEVGAGEEHLVDLVRPRPSAQPWFVGVGRGQRLLDRTLRG